MKHQEIIANNLSKRRLTAGLGLSRGSTQAGSRTRLKVRKDSVGSKGGRFEDSERRPVARGESRRYETDMVDLVSFLFAA
jgi:hypothetical protein